MTLQAIPAVIPEPLLTAAIRRLKAARLDASVLQQDTGPAEIAVSYFPRRRESAMQAFMRTQSETTYWRVWATAAGTAKITSDQFNQEWDCADLDEAVSALAAITAKSGRA